LAQGGLIIFAQKIELFVFYVESSTHTTFYKSWCVSSFCFNFLVLAIRSWILTQVAWMIKMNYFLHHPRRAFGRRCLVAAQMHQSQVAAGLDDSWAETCRRRPKPATRSAPRLTNRATIGARGKTPKTIPTSSKPAGKTANHPAGTPAPRTSLSYNWEKLVVKIKFGRMLERTNATKWWHGLLVRKGKVKSSQVFLRKFFTARVFASLYNRIGTQKTQCQQSGDIENPRVLDFVRITRGKNEFFYFCLSPFFTRTLYRICNVICINTFFICLFILLLTLALTRKTRIWRST